ncbi:MAG: NfeD family protein [Acidaminococcaceae bacterium]|nr:NfeD family protein [Acidaminococcaceae bacterium]
MGASRATLIVLAIGIVVVLMLVGIVIKSLPKNPLWQRLVLKNKPQSITPQQNNLAEYTGKKGKTETLLRPSGVAIIDGERLDVVTEGEFFPAGTKIVVNKVVGNKIFVKKEN